MFTAKVPKLPSIAKHMALFCCLKKFHQIAFLLIFPLKIQCGWTSTSNQCAEIFRVTKYTMQPTRGFHIWELTIRVPYFPTEDLDHLFSQMASLHFSIFSSSVFIFFFLSFLLFSGGWLLQRNKIVQFLQWNCLILHARCYFHNSL